MGAKGIRDGVGSISCRSARGAQSGSPVMTSPLGPGVCSLSGKCVTLNPKYFTTVCVYVCARVCVLGVAEYICDSPTPGRQR